MTDAEKKLAAIAKIVENGTIEDVRAVLEGKPKKWVPEDGDKHYYIDPAGDINEDIWNSFQYQPYLIDHNNCFKTEEEAIRVRDYRQRHGHKDSILSLMEEAARKDREANPDNTKAWRIHCSSKQRTRLWVVDGYIFDFGAAFNFHTKEAAQAFIDKYEDELEVLKPEEK